MNSASTTAPASPAPASGGPAFQSSSPRHKVAQLTETQQPNGSDTLRLAQLVRVGAADQQRRQRPPPRARCRLPAGHTRRATEPGRTTVRARSAAAASPISDRPDSARSRPARASPSSSRSTVRGRCGGYSTTRRSQPTRAGRSGARARELPGRPAPAALCAPVQRADRARLEVGQPCSQCASRAELVTIVRPGAGHDGPEQVPQPVADPLARQVLCQREREKAEVVIRPRPGVRGRL
jgi:hypothetical protein